MAKPTLWTGGRLVRIAVLAVSGILQATAAMIAASAGSTLLIGGASDDRRGVLVATVMIAAAGLFALRVLQRRLAERVALGYVAELRSGLISHVLRLPAASKTTGSGLVMTRVVNDLTAIKNWIAAGLATALTSVFVCLGVLGFLWLRNPNLAILLAPAVGLWLVIAAATLRPLNRHIRESRRQRGRIATRAARVLSARLSLLLHGRHGQIVRRFDRLSSRLNGSLVARATFSGVIRGAGDLLFPAVALTAAVIAVAAPIDLGASELALVVFGAGILAAQLTTTGTAAEYWLAHRVAMTRLDRVFAQPAIDHRPERAGRRGARPEPNIVVRDTRTDLAFEASAGEVIALTELRADRVRDLFQRLCRIAPPAGLEISLGGKPMAAYTPAEWWRHVALVSDTLPLTHTDPVRAALAGARASEPSNASDVLVKFGIAIGDGEPQGRTFTTRKTAALRAARAVLRHADLVLVDDPVVAGDEEILTTLLDCLAESKTIVVIGQRTDSARHRIRTVAAVEAEPA